MLYCLHEMIALNMKSCNPFVTKSSPVVRIVVCVICILIR